MVLFGYFLDCFLARFLIGTYFRPCFAFVFSFFTYTREKNFDHFLYKIGIQCFLAFLFFHQNFLFDFSYFILFYTLFFLFFFRIESKKQFLFSFILFFCGYYLYGGIFYFLIQKPLPFGKWIQMIISSIPMNLIFAFLFSIFWSKFEKRRI